MRNKEKERDAPVRFATDALLLTDWIDTTNLVAVGGRGVAKSTVIIARRSLRCVRLMPGAPLAIVADTYANLVDNIMPAVQNGWRLQGLLEGVHYVKGRRPPEAWRTRCSVIVDDYRHVYSFWNGSVLFLGSLDSPSLLAGKSVAHLFFDEAKYASDSRAARVMPILRGDAIAYGHCHLYGGVTITTDMPDVNEGEYDWFFRYAAEMDPPRIEKTVQAAGLLNRVRMRLAAIRQDPAPPDLARLARLERKERYYVNALAKLRKGQTYFMNISSFANIDVLTLDYARRLWGGALEPHEFCKSVLGMKPGLRKSSRFYILWDETHKYYDGTRSGEAAFSCRELVWLDRTRPIDGGMDFGNMLSLVVGQESGRTYRVLKNLCQLPPGWIRELADQFLEFFAGQECRELNLYYDRAGNDYHRQKIDMAGQVRDAIEKDADGRRTGWTVRLMSRRQATLAQGSEYNFQIELMGGRNKALPRLLVDAVNCRELVSSIELARSTVRYKGTVKVVQKVKKSEKLALQKLPMLSTNFSDAFKYLVMRRDWLRALRSKSGPGSGADGAADSWLDSRLGGDGGDGD